MSSEEREKFARQANKRVNIALKAIQDVGNLSNRANYDYTADDVNKIVDTLQKAVNDCQKRFELALNVDNWVDSQDNESTGQ